MIFPPEAHTQASTRGDEGGFTVISETFVDCFGEFHIFDPGSEGGVLDFGADMLPSNNPVELGMARLISTDKGDYIGKTAIESASDLGAPLSIRKSGEGLIATM